MHVNTMHTAALAKMTQTSCGASRKNTVWYVTFFFEYINTNLSHTSNDLDEHTMTNDGNHANRHLQFFNPLPGATSENVCAGRTSQNIRSRSVKLLPNKKISIQSRENLVNNNSMRLSLLPPAPFTLSLCSKRK